ncbi:MAG TPA: DNA ligase D [Vicinamibacteria bacterium]|nr:DNA ligase D [Vicinamibacteria bacterium]
MASREDDSQEALTAYRAKRTASETPEPFGGETEASPVVPGEPRLFVVQKHQATRLHYDFRLEWGGVLHSWAIPRGPSLDPAEKRMAIQVEDHPVEYADFEGVIPEGNYGAGHVIAWDRGVFIPHDDLDQGLAQGKLTFELRGYKLRGLWHLFRTGGKAATGKEWMLVKKPDGWVRSGGEAQPSEASIFSGLTLEEMESGPQRAEVVRSRLEELGAPRRPLGIGDVKVMLAEHAEAPFSSPEWLFEIKYDGFRVLGAREGSEARLVYRRGNPATHVFPEIARALRALPVGDLVVDGEAVVLDDDGRPSFQSLQKRVQLQRPADLERASWRWPATYFVFDLLAFEGYDLRALHLDERKRLLGGLLPTQGPLRLCDHVLEQGEDFHHQVRRAGLEGVMAKRAAAPYVAGRSPHWLKMKVERTGDFVVVGFTEPKGTRSGLGALHLAAHEGDGLVYAGRVGSGFTEDQLARLRVELDALRRSDPPCAGEVPRGRENVFVEPRLVCEVRYLDWTEEGLLRQPVFLRFRDDKAPEDCQLDRRRGLLPRPSVDTPPPVPPRLRSLSFTNLGKVFWPDERITKGDLIEFYRTVSPWLLPYLRDRPLVMTRYPDGIAGKSFYQKDAPDFAPDWLKTISVYSEHSARSIRYFVCEDVPSLLYLANLGTIPLHVWASRVGNLQHPDWCILDLDPKGAPFGDVIRIALALKELADRLGLPAFVKTSGSTGLHVLIPLGAQCTFEQSRSLAQLMAWFITLELGALATIARSLKDRQGKVYIDFLQNVHGQLLVAPWSVRPLPGAPVSTPLDWSEVREGLSIGDFTLRTVPGRLEQVGDPLLPLLGLQPDLLTALERLERLLGDRGGA